MPPDHTPSSSGSGITDFMPGMVIVFDVEINAGKITETKLISTIDMENKKTIHEITAEFILLVLLLSVNICT